MAMTTTADQMISAPTAITAKRSAMRSASRPAVTSADWGPSQPATLTTPARSVTIHLVHATPYSRSCFIDPLTRHDRLSLNSAVRSSKRTANARTDPTLHSHARAAFNAGLVRVRVGARAPPVDGPKGASLRFNTT